MVHEGREIVRVSRRTVSIENEELRVTVTVEGGHIEEITEKSTGVNPLWTPPWPSIEPSQHSFEKNPEYGANSESKLLAGIRGHNLALDVFGAPSPEEFRGGLTVHGEASVVPYEIETQGVSIFPSKHANMLATAHLPLAMLDFEREIRLEPGGIVRIREKVTNLLAMDRPIAWTQHVTLGPPFIEHGVTQLRLPARRSMVYPIDLSEHQRYRPGAEFEWPMVPHKDGSHSDLSVFPNHERSAGVTCHAVDADCADGFFMTWNPSSQLLFGYVWRREDFPWISLWEENRSREVPPWNGITVTRGVEFGVSPFAEGRRNMVERGSLFGIPTYRWLAANSNATVEYLAFARRSEKMREDTRFLTVAPHL
jgi:hypothetical protein